MTVVVPSLENFVSLHRGEETIRAKSLEELHKAELIHHGVVLEAAMSVLHHFTIAWATDDQDKLIIQLLGIRLFNAAAVALKLFLSGYYQGAAGQLRDALETAFLLELPKNRCGANREVADCVQQGASGIVPARSDP